MMDNAKLMDENRAKYPELLEQYLAEAEVIFGPKITYIMGEIKYHNDGPMVYPSDEILMTQFEPGYDVYLKSQALLDLKDGIFQLSHEVVHLLSPVPQDESPCNYLEEGMAVHFSKAITERDTGDVTYGDQSLALRPNYQQAYSLYQQLIALDPDAVKKLREKEAIIGDIKPEHFRDAGIDASDQLIAELLTTF
jgi:tetratricopeptide (TPR) repeat protein